jgi:hypothetical protein
MIDHLDVATTAALILNSRLRVAELDDEDTSVYGT